MKPTLTAIALILMSATATAEQPVTCERVAEIAKATMVARQNGFSMVKAMEATQGKEFLKNLVIDAWGVPQYRSPEYRANAANEFRDERYLKCVTGR